MRALVVANPIAGRGRGAEIGRRVVDALGRRSIAASLHLTGARGDGIAHVTRPEMDADVVVAVGGDGTVREVFEGLADPARPVGIVPAGTANVLARDLGLPWSVEAAVDVIARGVTARLDVARANGRLCLLGASAGFDATVVSEVDRRRRGPISRLSYVRAALVALPAYRPPRLTVEVDGDPVSGEYGLIIVANVVHYGGVFRLSPQRQLDDGVFEVYALRETGRIALCAAAVRGVCGVLHRWGCTMRPARLVRVASLTGPVPCQIDGDAAGVTPLDLTVTSTPYTVLVPERPR